MVWMYSNLYNEGIFSGDTLPHKHWHLGKILEMGFSFKNRELLSRAGGWSGGPVLCWGLSVLGLTEPSERLGLLLRGFLKNYHLELWLKNFISENGIPSIHWLEAAWILSPVFWEMMQLVSVFVSNFGIPRVSKYLSHLLIPNILILPLSSNTSCQMEKVLDSDLASSNSTTYSLNDLGQQLNSYLLVPYL